MSNYKENVNNADWNESTVKYIGFPLYYSMSEQ